MRNLCFSVLLAASSTVLCPHVNAAVRTVNNSTAMPGNPGQYTTINAAITASATGDTILVAGSANSYDAGGITFSKRICLLGAGYNPDNQARRSSIIAGNVTFTSVNASGSTIMGFKIAGDLLNQSGVVVSNVTIRRNHFTGRIAFDADTSKYMSFSENIFQNSLLFPTNKGCPGLAFNNNVFCGDYGSGNVALLQLPYTYSSVDEVIIDHNLFVNGKYGCTNGWCSAGYTTSTGFIKCRNAAISNNIFINMVPIDISSSGTTYIGNTFTNNITYRSGSSWSNLPYGTNYGSGNINNTNPVLTTLFSSSSNVYLDFNTDRLHPGSGSPLISAASDGTDIGPTGGLYPIYSTTNPLLLTGEPPVPQVKSINYVSGSTVAPGGSLNLQIRAKRIR
jgi:hypothetical protein